MRHGAARYGPNRSMCCTNSKTSARRADGKFAWTGVCVWRKYAQQQMTTTTPSTCCYREEEAAYVTNVREHRKRKRKHHIREYTHTTRVRVVMCTIRSPQPQRFAVVRAPDFMWFHETESVSLAIAAIQRCIHSVKQSNWTLHMDTQRRWWLWWWWCSGCDCGGSPLTPLVYAEPDHIFIYVIIPQKS